MDCSASRGETRQAGLSVGRKGPARPTRRTPDDSGLAANGGLFREQSAWPVDTERRYVVPVDGFAEPSDRGDHGG